MSRRTRPGPKTESSLAPIAVALVVAAMLAPVVRSVSVELNHSVGRVWPFSYNHCHTPTTPGCDTEPANPRAPTPHALF